MTFLISVLSVGTAFAYEAETYPDDTFSDNVIIEDYVTASTSANADLVINGNAMTFTPKKTTGTTNNQYGDTIDGKDWQNTGRVEVYYTVSYEGELVSGDVYGMGIGLTAFNGTSRAWILGGVASYGGFKFESGVTKNIKHVVEFTDKQTIVTSYTKFPDETEWTHAFTVTNDFAAAPEKRHIREILPFSQHNFNKGTEYVSATISDVSVVEVLANPVMTDVSGNYLGLDDIDVSYYIPKDYKAATLSFNGEVLREFDPEVDDFGSYNTYFNLMQFDVVGENIPLKLEVTLADDSIADATEYITVTEPILEPSFEDVSGEYTSAKTVTVNFELPHVYSTAQLTYNGDVIASYNCDEHSGGPYSEDIVLKDYGYVGEDLPIVLTVTYEDKEDDEFSSLITVTESYPEAILTQTGGVYLVNESVSTGYTLPDDYDTATLTFNGEVVAEHDGSDDKPGRYTADIAFADYNAVGLDLPLTLTVKMKDNSKKELKALFDVVEIMAINELLTEDFEDESYMVTNDTYSDFTPEQINSTKFDSRVYQHEFTTKSYARSQILKGGLSINAGQCLDVSYDVNVSSKGFVGGLHSKKDTSTWYSEQRFQRDGKFLDKMEYETDTWYNVLYRIFPGAATRSGKHEIHLYVDGNYVGTTETVYTGGFGQIGIDYVNGYNLGMLYIDNIKMVTYAPMYDVTMEGADGSKEADANKPVIKAIFDQKMSTDSMTSDNIKLIGFNGAEVKCALSFDDATHTLTLVPDGKLVPGKEYTLKLSDSIATAYGAYYVDGYTAKINTAKAAFAIDSISVGKISANKEFKTEVIVSNASGATQNARLFAALYVDGRLESICNVDASGSYTSDDFDLTLKAPASVNGDVKVCVYLVNGATGFSVIDWAEK